MNKVMFVLCSEKDGVKIGENKYRRIHVFDLDNSDEYKTMLNTVKSVGNGFVAKVDSYDEENVMTQLSGKNEIAEWGTFNVTEIVSIEKFLQELQVKA